MTFTGGFARAEHNGKVRILLLGDTTEESAQVNGLVKQVAEVE